MPTIDPHVYLDTCILIDYVHNRNKDSISLITTIRSKKWRCTTSRWTALEMYDVEQEESFVEKYRLKGLMLSHILRKLSDRRSKRLGLSERELSVVHEKLHDTLLSFEGYVNFIRPNESIFTEAERFCTVTNIGANDALHLATAKNERCNILVTTDKSFCQIADEYIVATLPQNFNKALDRLVSPPQRLTLL